MARGNNTGSVQATFWLPRIVADAVRSQAATEGCSMSWIVGETLMERFGITDDDVNQARGFAIPKTFEERKASPDWTPNKKADNTRGRKSKTPVHTYACLNCDKQVCFYTERELDVDWEAYTLCKDCYELYKTDGRLYIEDGLTIVRDKDRNKV